MIQEFKKPINALLETINLSSASGTYHLLHFPIISMRSYVTDLYDLTCDGNFNRLVSVWLNLIDAYIESMKGENDISYITKINNLHITVVLPHWSKMTPQSLEIVRKAIDAGKGFLSFEMSDMFPSGGPKQERSLSGGISLSKCLVEMIEKYAPSVIVYEPEYLGLYCETMKSLSMTADSGLKTIFWCPVSSTLDEDPSFLDNVKHVDIELAKSCDLLIVATEKQAEYFARNGKSLYEILVNPILIDSSLDIFSFDPVVNISEFIDKYVRRGYKIVYFPFRMTDPGYQFDGVMSTLIALAGFGNKILFLYSDPNDSKKVEVYRGIKEVQNGNLLLERVSSARDTYYTIISNQNVVVPYLENIDNIMHASWQEMQYYETNIVRDTKNGLLSDAFLEAFENIS